MAPVQRKGLRALQIWCGQVTADYANVHITDLSTSFRDGLAFNAIIHHFRPDLFDYKLLNPASVRENNAHAFKIAEEELNIPALLDPEDMVDCEEPDKFSVATYLAQMYHLFKSVSPPATPSRASLSRLSSSEGENDSLLSTSSSDSPPSLATFRKSDPPAVGPTYNRSDLIAKYGEDIFSCSSPPAVQKTYSPVLQTPAPVEAVVTKLGSSPQRSPPPVVTASNTTTQKKNESNAVASVRKQFEQFAKISAS